MVTNPLTDNKVSLDNGIKLVHKISKIQNCLKSYILRFNSEKETRS